jgi:hypothetical protein
MGRKSYHGMGSQSDLRAEAGGSHGIMCASVLVISLPGLGEAGPTCHPWFGCQILIRRPEEDWTW